MQGTQARGRVAKRIRAILLDADGTLVDSNDAHAEAWVDAGREFGYDVTFDRARWLMGLGADRVLARLTGLAEFTDEGAQILKRRGEIFRERYLPGVRAFPGTHDLLCRLRDDGCRLVIATSASAADLPALLRQGRLESFIDAGADADRSGRTTRAPDIVEAALRRADESPDHAVLLGDSPYDVRAAGSTGVPVITLRCGGWSDDELHGAAEIHDDPRALLRHYTDSLISE
jgi:phosphoglycolate phosphatase-like HAD superfamily hydrolase